MPDAHPKSVANIESFITLLRVACEDQEVYERLEKILGLPDEKRKSGLQALVTHMQKAHAPNDFITAIACLIDTDISERAYEAIYKCQRRIL